MLTRSGKRVEAGEHTNTKIKKKKLKNKEEKKKKKKRNLGDDEELAAFLKEYQSGKHPASFAGITKVKKHYPHFSLKKIENYLSHADVWSRHSERKKPSCFNPVFVYKKRTVLEADLLQIDNLARSNDGVRFLLVCIDTFSKKIFVQTLKQKSMSAVAPALDIVLTEMNPEASSRMCTDFGVEFLNKQVRGVAEKHGIQLTNSKVNKCSNVERVIKTLKELIMKFITAKENRRYVDNLNDLVKVYNDRHHRTIDTSPNKADLAKNQADILDRLRFVIDQKMDKCSKRAKQQKTKFEIGDIVRYSRNKNIFSRSYDESHVIRVAEIKRILKHLPLPMYELQEYKNDKEVIVGKFYEEELRKYSGSVFKVEKILKEKVLKGVTQVLVKWLGYKESEATWIPKSNITNSFSK